MLLQWLSPQAAMWVGRRVGDVAFLVNPRNRRKAYQNLRIAFGAEKSPRELQRILRNFYRVYGQNVVEVGRLSLIARKGFEDYVSLDGREHVDAAMREGRGLIFLSMHSGNWEFSNIVGSMIGYPYNMVANYLANVNKVADLLDSWRQSAGCRIINPGLGGREIIKALKRNEIVTLVADQGGRDGLLAPFFGLPSSMSTGAVRIALKYNVPICLVNIYRVASDKHSLDAEPFVLTRTGNMEADIRVNIERIASRFEALIRLHPHEYLWFYKTWKYSRHRKIVILDDGRTGHLRQSQAVAKMLTNEMSQCGLESITETIIVTFIDDQAVFLLRLFSQLRPVISGLGIAALKPFLTSETWVKIASTKPDYVISCGGRNSLVNIWMAKDNHARNIHILSPGGADARDFDMIVQPQHDAFIKAYPHVVVTRTAPNLIDKAYLDSSVRNLLERFSHLKSHSRPRLGILLGGDTKGLVLGEQQVRVILHQIKGAAERFNADVLITTSRRTSSAVEALVVREMKGYSRCALMILASKQTVPEAVGGILGLSDIVVVSGESVSMISEAMASGKRTVVFPVEGPDRKPLVNKYSRFLAAMSEGGFLITAKSTYVAEALDSLLRDKVKTRPLDDKTVLAEALRKIVI